MKIPGRIDETSVLLRFDNTGRKSAQHTIFVEPTWNWTRSNAPSHQPPREHPADDHFHSHLMEFDILDTVQVSANFRIERLMARLTSMCGAGAV
jgi:hypothetical protein